MDIWAVGISNQPFEALKLKQSFQKIKQLLEKLRSL